MTPAELAAIAARGHADAGELASLRDALGAPTKAVQRGAAETLAALARAGQAVDDVLAGALVDGAPRRRWGAAYAWSRLGSVPPACLPVLLEALGSDDGDLRWASAAILRGLGDLPELVPALRGLLASPSPLQRKMALYCLRDLNACRSGLDAEMRGALDDPDAAVRLAAMSALASLAEDRAAAARALLMRLEDADAGVRRAAAAALGRLGAIDPDVTNALRRALVTGDAGLARAAAGALAALDARQAVR
jgi:HEAT repeat protein